MSEQEPHSNPWADKLDQVSLPNLAEVKQQLFLQMDKDAHVVKKWRRWPWLLALLLILLIGVCNCPGGWKMNDDRVNDHAVPVDTTLAVKDKHKIAATEANNTQQEMADSNSPHNDKPGDVHIENDVKQKTTFRTTHSSTEKKIVSPSSVKHAASNKTRLGNYSSRNRNKSLVTGKNVPKNDNAIKNSVERTSGANDIAGNNKNNMEGDKKQPVSTTTVLPVVKTPIDSIPAADSAALKIDSAGNVSKADSTKKKPVGKKGKWAIAIGINQHVPINGQQYAGINAQGNRNITGDYIPVPQVRYHINDELYLQLELDLHSPQYTQQLLIARRSDTIASGFRPIIYVKKLYYFRVPLGMHYSPVKHFYAGAGIQFSRLTNAAAAYVVRDSMNNSSTLTNLKGDPAYALLHTTDWGFYVDFSYHWKELGAGVRYNKSFGNFINTSVPGFPDARASNSSLQLYIRYTIWRSNRQKKSTVK